MSPPRPSPSEPRCVIVISPSALSGPPIAVKNASLIAEPAATSGVVRPSCLYCLNARIAARALALL